MCMLRANDFNYHLGKIVDMFSFYVMNLYNISFVRLKA